MKNATRMYIYIIYIYIYVYMYIFRCGPKGKLKVFEIKVSTNNGESLDHGAFAFE